VAVGDLSCREIKCDTAINDQLSERGAGSSGRERSLHAVFGRARCPGHRLIYSEVVASDVVGSVGEPVETGVTAGVWVSDCLVLDALWSSLSSVLSGVLEPGVWPGYSLRSGLDTSDNQQRDEREEAERQHAGEGDDIGADKLPSSALFRLNAPDGIQGVLQLNHHPDCSAARR
jgi:hypothetical protein